MRTLHIKKTSLFFSILFLVTISTVAGERLLTDGAKERCEGYARQESKSLAYVLIPPDDEMA